MSFKDELKNAPENKRKRDEEERIKEENKERQIVEACTKESYEHFKNQILREAENGKKECRGSIDFNRYMENQGYLYSSLLGEEEKPTTFYERFKSKYGAMSKRSGNRIVFHPFYPLKVIQMVEGMIATFLEEDGFTDYKIERIEQVYTDGKGTFFDEPCKSGYQTYRPQIDITVRW